MTWCKRPRRRLDTSIFFRSTSASRFNDSAASYSMSPMSETQIQTFCWIIQRRWNLLQILFVRYRNPLIPHTIIRDKHWLRQKLCTRKSPDQTWPHSSVRCVSLQALELQALEFTRRKNCNPSWGCPFFTWNAHYNKTNIQVTERTTAPNHDCLLPFVSHLLLVCPSFSRPDSLKRTSIGRWRHTI